MYAIYSEHGIHCYVFTITMSNLPHLATELSENTFGSEDEEGETESESDK